MDILRLLLFNPLNKGYIKQAGRFIAFGRRYRSMVIDMLYTMSISAPIIILFIIDQIISGLNDDHFDDLHSTRFWISMFVFFIICFTLFNKDHYRAKSVAKRVCGYQIIDVKTGEIAHPAKCALRNITAFIWPLEAITLLITPNRRLGDYIAGTALIDANTEDPETILIDIREPKSYTDIKRTLVVSVVITLFLLGLALLPSLHF